MFHSNGNRVCYRITKGIIIFNPSNEMGYGLGNLYIGKFPKISFGSYYTMFGRKI